MCLCCWFRLRPLLSGPGRQRFANRRRVFHWGGRVTLLLHPEHEEEAAILLGIVVTDDACQRTGRLALA